MRFTLLLALGLGVTACAVGSPAGDEIVGKKIDGGAPAHDSGSPNNPTDQDTGSNQSTCLKTLCGSACVDIESDPNNCGGCGIVCSDTCSSGQCSGTQPPPTNGNEPPQGTCGHSLCSSGGALDEGCDTLGCTVVICDPDYLDDEFCCASSWDSQCEQEVTDYCQPYSCN